MQRMAYDIILWDWNGTLLDDCDYCAEIINGMLSRRGMPVRSREEHGQLFDFPVIRYYERIGFDFKSEPFEVLSQEFIEGYYANVKGCALKAGSRRILTDLQEAGYRQAVLSASYQDHLEEQIGYHQLTSHFEVLIGIDTIHATGKTGRGCDWISESGVDPARVLLIGDTMHDAEVATGMGIDCWLVCGGHHPANRLESTGRRCMENLESVEALLLSKTTGGMKL